jgi:hypothetical protein
MRFYTFTTLALLTFGSLGIPGHAGVIVVNAADNIYGAGQGSAPGGGNLPGFIVLTPGTISISFSSITGSTPCGSAEGCITLNGGGNYNDPDGAGAGTGSSSNSGSVSISGISALGAGYLVGLFVSASDPSGTAPTALSYTTTSDASYSPALDQTFFIGDGLTGDGTGTVQVFNAPTGAVDLYLGISDAGGYNGPPSAYGDNFGDYTAVYALTGGTSSTPEPGTVLLFGLGFAGLACLRLSPKKPETR